MANTSCSRCEPLLSQFVDGELGTEDTSTVRQHLETCADCKVRVTTEERVRQRILDARYPAVSSATVARLLLRARNPVVRWGQLAAAALIAAVIPFSIAVSTPRRQPSCTCDVVTPALDTEL
jgi:anti-sigma factor RsiW